MNLTYEQQFEKIKKILQIENIISVRFSDSKTKEYEKYNDTACTILARVFQKSILTYIDRNSGQSCPGGDFFLNIKRFKQKKICDVYVKQEKIFKNNKVCLDFLDDLPKYPFFANKRYILFTPLIKEKQKPDVIIILANAAQSGRILGLNAYKKYHQPLVIPAISTCASIFLPLATNQLHINFIDYFDRYYQGKQNNEFLWNDNQLILSMPYYLFYDIIKNIPLSAQGSYQPKIKVQKFDEI